MGKKNIFILTSILFLLGLPFILLLNKSKQNQQNKEVYQSIPVFKIPDTNGNIITEALLRDYKTVMFIYFNPDCDLCVDEIKQIKENESIFTKGKIVFFSELPADKIRFFLQKIDFIPTQNILFLPDEESILINKMEVRIVPTVYIYKYSQLIKRFDGPVKIETLIQYFTED
jgi:peroxiredoxin